ncbi:translation initiation factor eIF-2B subunit delta-like isoform X2 [Teleopsis dalmanni]|uniref:translation initiation factor eIF-2B subunit delta-like isoform X2 n=1 Tax=Teleopsis dalmanni TaxID=139649 RepID=UPI0018CE7C26|nr:translation initiation factor eIF-2B subunit delta-like isoform X2 [Teleopsis dalmanni]
MPIASEIGEATKEPVLQLITPDIGDAPKPKKKNKRRRDREKKRNLTNNLLINATNAVIQNTEGTTVNLNNKQPNFLTKVNDITNNIGKSAVNVNCKKSQQIAKQTDKKNSKTVINLNSKLQQQQQSATKVDKTNKKSENIAKTVVNVDNKPKQSNSKAKNISGSSDKTPKVAANLNNKQQTIPIAEKIIVKPKKTSKVTVHLNKKQQTIPTANKINVNPEKTSKVTGHLKNKQQTIQTADKIVVNPEERSEVTDHLHNKQQQITSIADKIIVTPEKTTEVPAHLNNKQQKQQIIPTADKIVVTPEKTTEVPAHLNIKHQQQQQTIPTADKIIATPEITPKPVVNTNNIAKQQPTPKENINIDIPVKTVEISEMSSSLEKRTSVTNTGGGIVTEKNREQIEAERKAKKQAKQAAKLAKSSGSISKEITGITQKLSDLQISIPKTTTTTAQTAATPVENVEEKQSITKTDIKPTVVTKDVGLGGEKSREQIKAEREAKKQAKQASKLAKNTNTDTNKEVTELNTELSNTVSKQSVTVPASETITSSVEEKKKPALTKAERRAIQEAQRAAKAQALTAKSSTTKPAINDKSATVAKTASPPITKETKSPSAKATTTTSPAKQSKFIDIKMRLFSHLECARTDVSLFVNNSQIHPSIARLGEQYAHRTIVGSNARCIAFLNALKMVIHDFETPPKKEFSRSLEVFIKNCVEHLQKCRPLAVSVTNAYKHIKHVLTQLPTEQPESELKGNLCHFIDTYIENQIGKAAQAISSSMQEKICNGDVILTFGCSSLINFIFEEAQKRGVNFRVIVVDSRPFCEGQELLRRLAAKEIPCTYVLINALGFVMRETTKVLLGAHALLANGYVMARTGTAQVALVARAFNVPVLVCCETHKFSERFQTDAIVYNELGNPNDLVINDKCCLTNWQAKGKMTPLNLIYDITPPELVTAVATEVSILPCTSVPVILRIKPTEIGYYS